MTVAAIVSWSNRKGEKRMGYMKDSGFKTTQVLPVGKKRVELGRKKSEPCRN